MEAFSRALKINPEDGGAYHGVARVYAERGKGTLAMEHFAKALKFEKDQSKKNAMLDHLFKIGGTWDA
jgi:Tfp pilus assembly protein PilF